MERARFRVGVPFVAAIASGLLACGSLACGPSEPPSPPGLPPSASTVAGAAQRPASPTSAAGAASATSPTAPLTTEPLAVMRPPAISFAAAVDITYPTGAPDEAKRCKSETSPASAAAKTPVDAERADDEARIRCLLGVRFAADVKTRDLAIDLFEKLGSVTGVITEHTMDGGWRGDLHLVPEPPVGHHRKHLQWVKSGFEEIDSFFAGLDARRPPGTKSTYRYRALGLRFLRSVGRTTPSAYANDWDVSYNVSGSLHAGPDAVRETLFHEVFHLNDGAHGRWSSSALTPIVDAILAECGQKTACLAPYAPGTTMVRGGTYYAFQKGNGVWEYAAELATRYYTEHRAILRGEKLGKPPFKCGPPANQKAWTALVDEFFGADLTPACAAK